METQVQQKEYADATAARDMMTIQGSEAGSLAKTTNTDASYYQGSAVGRNISEFLQQLPKKIREFSNEYKLQVISFTLLVVMVIGLRFVLAVIDAINQVPLASTIFELIGIGYITWFVSRLFLAGTSGRSE
jgi:CAAD domains of cyanobacterial aminoacyl-tRNA synthetase